MNGTIVPVIFRMPRVDSMVRLDGSEPANQWENLLGRQIKSFWSCPDLVAFNGEPLEVQEAKDFLFLFHLFLFVADAGKGWAEDAASSAAGAVQGLHKRQKPVFFRSEWRL